MALAHTPAPTRKYLASAPMQIIAVFPSAACSSSDRKSLNSLLSVAANTPCGLLNPFCLNDLCPGLHNSVKENIQPSSLLSFIVPKEVRSSGQFA